MFISAIIFLQAATSQLLMPSSALAPPILSQGGVLDDPKLDAMLTMDFPAGSIEAALKQIAEKSGVALTVAPQMKTPVVVVNVKDVKVKDVLTRLAKVTSGDWIKSEDAIRLVSDGAQQRKEQNEERKTKLEQIQKAVKDLAGRFDPSKRPKTDDGGSDADVQEALQMAMAMGSGDASSKAISRILTQLDLSILAGIEQGQRVVFSTNPNLMQRALPNNLGPVFSELIADHNKNVASRPQEIAGDDTEEMRQLQEFYQSLFGGGSSDKPVNERPAKALFIVGSREIGFGLEAELRLYGSSGKVLLTGNTVLPIDNSGYLQEAIAFGQTVADQAAGKGAPAADDKPLEISAEAKELRGFFGSMTGGGMDRQLSQPLMDKLIRPDLFDPLSFGAGETLRAAAIAKGVNLVANLPDESESMFAMFAGAGAATMNATLDAFSKGDTKSEMKDGWLTVWPARAETARVRRQDRVALAKLIGASRAKGFAALDDIAAYSLTSRPPTDTPVAMSYLMLFASNAMQSGMDGMVDWNMLRFYATLGLSQRQSLAGGAPLPFGALIPTQRNHVVALSFGTEAQLEVEGVGPQQERTGFMKLITQFMPVQTGDYREEPTESMPNGLPGAGTVKLSVANSIIGKPVGGGAIGQMMATIGADELALFKYFTEDPKMAQLGEMMPKLDGLKLGSRRSYTFTFTVAPGVTIKKTLNDDSVDRNAPVTKMEDLPADLKSAIDQRVAELKKNPLPFGFGGSQTIPPR